MDLTVMVFDITSKYPKQETYGLVSQSRRATVSIPSNIAEGYGKRSLKEYKQFMLISYSSSLELETQLILAYRLKFISDSDYQKVIPLLQEVQKMLNSMTSKLRAIWLTN